MALVSIVVPVYNCEEDLYDCLESLEKQSYKNIEVILVNDGSIDNSLEICKQFSQRDSRFIVFSQENQGVSRARNKGVELSSGEYVMFVDGDDKVYLDMVRVYLENIEKNKSDIVIGGLTVCEENGKIWHKFPQKEGTFGNEVWNDIVVDDTGVYGYVTNKLFRNTYLKNKIFFNEKMYAQEDLDFNLSVYHVCQKFTLIKSSYYFYKYRPGKRKHPILHYIGNQIKMYVCAEDTGKLENSNKLVLKNRVAGMLYMTLYWSEKGEYDEIFDYDELVDFLCDSKGIVGEKKIIVAWYCRGKRKIIVFYFRVRHKIRKLLRRG